MATNRKSFNFRHGLQVDDTNFVINANGLVGIGSSVPTESLDVRDNAKIGGSLIVGSLEVTNQSSLNGLDVDIINVGITSIKSGIITSSDPTGIITYYGDARYLQGMPTSQWVDVDAGLGYISIYAAGNVGVGTIDPRFVFQVAGNTDTSVAGFTGVGIQTGGHILAAGIATAYSFSGFGTDITGINASNISNGTLSNNRLATTVIVDNVVSTFSGDLTGTATTASSLSGTPNIEVGIVTATNLNLTSTFYTTSNIGIGTALPTSEIQVRKASGSLVEVVSDSGQARISVGQSVGVGNSTGVLRFGNNSKTLDLINRDTGNLNFILHGGSAGVDTGRFDWLYGQDIVSPLMSLTHEGDLGIGKTNPTNTLHVVGTSTVTSTAYFGGDVRAKKIYFTELEDGVVKTNTNIISGISTFNKLFMTGGDNVLSINSSSPTGSIKFYIADSTEAYLGNKAAMGSPVTADATYFANNLDADAAQLKVYGNSYVGSDLYVRSNFYVGTGVTVGSGIVTATNGFTSGTGDPVQISVSGSTLTFTVGSSSTSLTLS